MNPKIKSFLIWFFAFIFTLAIAIYQRMTGPTYPIHGHVEIGQQNIKYKLIRTYDGSDNAPITVKVPDTSIKGELKLRRFKSYDKWETQVMQRHGDSLIGYLPHLATAGKVEYQVTLVQDNQRFLLNDQPAKLRYKGFVPKYVLYPHILFIFIAMLFSTLTGLMVVFKGKNIYIYTWITLITLFLGGLILGPIVQKFSFDAYWTGWPFGHDLTDNKSLVAFIFWLVALIIQIKNREKKLWALIASVILLIVFLIPHSMFGSEIDYTKVPSTETVK